jgi:hypothetical protein
MADAIDTGIYLASLFMELMFGVTQRTDLPIICLTDCHSLKDALDSTKQVSEKRLRIEVSSIRELIRQNTIHSIKWIKSENQLADCLTKKGASSLNLLRALQTGAWVNECLKQ